MQTFVLSYDRFDSASTPRLLDAEEIAHTTVVHSPEMLQRYVDCSTADPARILASSVPKGLARNRNWVLDNLVAPGEWCLMLVDDMWRVLELADYDSYPGETLHWTAERDSQLNRRLRHLASFRTLLRRAEELTRVADSEGVEIAGFSPFKNPMWRNHKYRRNVLCDGRCLVVKNSGWRWDPEVHTVDDYAICCEHIYSLGGTLCNYWVMPEARRYSPGGYGSKAQRAAQKRKDCEYLARKYPGLVQVLDKKHEPPGTHLRIAPLSPEQLNRLKSARHETIAPG